MAVQPGSFFFLKLYVKTKLGRNFKRNRYLGGCTYFFLFCLDDLAVGKFGPHPVGGYGVNRSKWEVRVASGPR